MGCVYVHVTRLTLHRNREHIDVNALAAKYYATHVSMGLGLNTLLLAMSVALNNQLSVTLCEFVSSQKQLVSHLVLICAWNSVQVMHGDGAESHSVPYVGTQRQIGALWIFLACAALICAICACVALWRYRSHCYVFMLSGAALALSLMASAVWLSMDGVCNDYAST